MKTLGLDLGTNSLGWAVIDTDVAENPITHKGVVVFEEGIKREKGSDSLETPAAERRKYRMGRRLKFRRRLRKFQILKLLIKEKMCPLTQEELDQWKKNGAYPLGNKPFIQWLKSTDTSNPYCDRAAAASHKIDLETLGRAIYHLAQRRGFKSSRKDAVEIDDAESKGKKKGRQSADTTNEAVEVESADKKQDSLGVVKGDIVKLTKTLEEKNCTLGQHFYELLQNGKKVRKTYTGRLEHYQKEFEVIAKVQGLTEELASKVSGILFYQRPLRPQTHLIGKCPLEKKHPRCMIAHPTFEAYRMWSFINNIRIIDESTNERTLLTHDERMKVKECFYKKAPYFDFADIRKALNKPKGTVFNYRDKQTIATASVSHQLNKVFGCAFEAWTHEGVSKKGTRVTYTYQTAFDALVFFQDDDKLSTFAQGKLGFSPEQAKAFVKIRIKDGYAQYSLCAIQKILPFLEQGIELSQAVFLAKIPDALGKETFDANREQIIADVQERNAYYKRNLDTRRSDNKIGVVPLYKLLTAYMTETWKLTTEQFTSLYFRDTNADDSYANAKVKNGDTLPVVNLGMIRNPLVQRSMTILRKLVNRLRHKGIIDGDTHIHIELARQVNDRNKRMAYETWQEERKIAHQEARKGLAEMGCTSPTDTDILRYILWKEQPGGKCLYTGKQINQFNLLGDAFDLEHTIPRCKSGNDSQANLTLCDRDYNRQVKKGRIPTECPNYEEEISVLLRPWQEKVEKLETDYSNQMSTAKKTPQEQADRRAQNRQKALVTKMKLNYWRDKVKAFERTADDLTESFMKRQLVDTGIMTRHAVSLLKTVYPKTYPVNGDAVAWVRKTWGVQGIFEKKDRTTHIHHAIDAMVIAALDRDRFNKICAHCKDDGEDCSKNLPDVLLPFDGFAQRVFDASEEILVKHLAKHKETKQTARKSVRLAKVRTLESGKKIRNVSAGGDTARGQLHKESFYGCIQDPENDGKETYVIRKEFKFTPLIFEKESDLKKIVDKTIREHLLEEVMCRMTNGNTFKKAMDDGNFTMPSGVPIKKVRIRSRLSDPKKLKKHVFLSKQTHKQNYYTTSGSGSLFRMALYKKEKQGKTKYDCLPDNMLDWAQQRSDYTEPHQRTDWGQFIGYIRPNLLALIYEHTPQDLMGLSHFELKKRLYKVVTLESDGRINLRYHSEARQDKDLDSNSDLSFEKPHGLLRLAKGTYFKHLLFEGIHFKMDLDGSILFEGNLC